MAPKKCCFCSTENLEKCLLDINTKVSGWPDGNDVQLSDIAFAITNFRLDDARICVDCQKTLFDFYVFKMKALKVLQAQQTMKTKMIQSFIAFLDNADSVETLSVMTNRSCFTVITAPISDGSEKNPESDKNDKRALPDGGEKSSVVDQSPIGIPDNESRNTLLTAQSRLAAKVKKLIRKMSLQSKTDNDKWTCCVCKAFTCSTSRGISVHIRCRHKAEVEAKCFETISTKGVPREAEVSSNVIDTETLSWTRAKVVESATSKGSWACCLCNDFKSTSRQGITAHIARKHGKRRARKVVSNKLKTPMRHNSNDNEKFRTNPLWIETMINRSKSRDQQGWKCCRCKKFSTSSIIRFRSHILGKNCVCEMEEKSVMNAVLDKVSKNISVNGSKSNNWDEMIKKSKIADGKGWKCCLCDNFFTRLSSGIRIHFGKMHRKHPVDESVTGNDQRSESKTANSAIEKFIVVTKSNDRDDSVYSCSVCHFKSKSRIKIKKHISRMHTEEHLNGRKNHPIRILSSESLIDANSTGRWTSFGRPDNESSEFDNELLMVQEYECDHCAKVFNRKDDLLRHMKEIFKINYFPCLSCDQRFESQADVSMHMMKHVKSGSGEMSDTCSSSD